MLPPLDDEEYELLIPEWAKKLDKEVPRTRLVVGMRVYDVLYGIRDGRNPHGIVVSVSDHPKWGLGIGVEMDHGGSCGSAASYFVPLPLEHDPKVAKSESDD